VQGKHLSERTGQVRGDARHQEVPLGGALAGDADLSRGEVPQTAVDELGAPAARAHGQVAALDEHRVQPAGRRVECRSGPDDSAADDQDVDGGQIAEARQLALAASRVEGGRPGRGAAHTGHGAMSSSPRTAAVSSRRHDASSSHSRTSGSDCTADWSTSRSIAAIAPGSPRRT